MFCLTSPTGVIKSNKLYYITLHPIPSVGGPEAVIHLIASWMNGVSRIMGFLEYRILISLMSIQILPL
jgi:hypothetical protein